MKATEEELITVEEIYRRHPDEWVLLEIVRDQKDTMRVVGRLLAHSPNRDDLDEPYERFRAEKPHARTYEFYTGEIAPKDVVVIL